jgi:hypothetical protein
MLDHSSWQCGDNPLPRSITPSDIDMGFDNGGWVLQCEVSSTASSWRNVPRGQVQYYLSSIKGTHNCAVLCYHTVPLSDSRPIDTRKDIKKFHVLLHVSDGFLLSPIYNGWEAFVLQWYKSPAAVREKCIEGAKGSRDEYMAEWPLRIPEIESLENENLALRRHIASLGREPDLAVRCSSCHELMNGEGYSVRGKYFHKDCRARSA